MALARILSLQIIFYIVMNLTILTQSQQVPCLFLFGDSVFDTGNNNLLATRVKANYRPYGIDYPGGPTGRFSNGRNEADFIAELLGFKQPIPPFATASGPDILQGVNYASGAAGIRDETGQNMGARFSLNRQLQNHQTTISRIRNLLKTRAYANNYLNKCLYVVNMGSVDYLNNYLQPRLYPASARFTPQQFTNLLIQQYSGQLNTLYNNGARKIAIFGLGLLGCTPQELAMSPIHGSPCVNSINNLAQLFNNMLKPLVDRLNRNLKGSQFIYINTFGISTRTSAAGIKVTNAPCCPVNSFGQCIPNGIPCANRNQYSFYDGFHPTEVYCRLIATGAYNATLPSDAYPFGINRLVQQR